MIMKQGDTYNVPLKINVGGIVVTATDVDEIELTFSNGLKKNYPGDMEFDTDHFNVSFTQEETFSLNGNVKYQVRVLFAGGDVKSSPKFNSMIAESISKTVLGGENNA